MMIINPWQQAADNTQTAAYPCWLILSHWLLESAPPGPIPLMLCLLQAQPVTPSPPPCGARARHRCGRRREGMDSALLPKDQNYRQRGGGIAVRRVSIATKALAVKASCGLTALVPGEWVGPCCVVLPVPPSWGRWDHPSWKPASSVPVVEMLCFQFWHFPISAQVNVAHLHIKCSPKSFRLGLSKGFWNLVRRGTSEYVVLLKLKQ